AGLQSFHQACTEPSMAPRATDRLQLHADFALDDVRSQVPSYPRLAVSHYYVSPITTACPGSTHGYDVADHRRVNPEIGGMEALRNLVRELRAHQMGLIVDIVPNHMAAHVANPWWRDVLDRKSTRLNSSHVKISY